MDIREQRSHNQAQELINLANDVMAHFSGTTRLFNYADPHHNPKFKEIKKLERKFKKRHKNNRVDVSEYLREFSIELVYIPERLHFLMRVMGWLDNDTYAPAPHLNGFYSDTYHDFMAKDLATKTWYFITVDRYIELLCIDCNLQNRYNQQDNAA